MKTFEYRGYHADGRRAKGLVEADSLKAARERLAAQGVLADRLRPVESAGSASRWNRPAVRAAVYRELASLVKAGLPFARAMEILIESPELGACRGELAAIRDRVREGANPADAFAASGRLSPFETAVLHAGQRAGALDTSLARLASFLEEQSRVGGKVRTALIYPALVSVLALVVASLMLGVMLPRFARIWEDAQVPLPALTVVVMGAGKVLIGFVLPVLVAAAMLALAFRDRLRRSDRLRLAVERTFARLPGARAAWTALVSMRFARTLALMIEGGVPMLEALGLAGRATGSLWVAREVDRETEGVRHGGTLADALRNIPPLAGSLPGWVQAGEAGGDLSGLLEAAAERQQDAWDRALTRSMALLEPALIIVIGSVVFLIALAILLPVLALNSGAG